MMDYKKRKLSDQENLNCDPEDLESLFDSVMILTDPDECNRYLNEAFCMLPSIKVGRSINKYKELD